MVGYFSALRRFGSFFFCKPNNVEACRDHAPSRCPRPFPWASVTVKAFISGIRCLDFLVLPSIVCKFEVRARARPCVRACGSTPAQVLSPPSTADGHPCSYMQVTVEAAPSLMSNDRKPRDQASRGGRGSACTERAEAGEERLAEELSVQT